MLKTELDAMLHFEDYDVKLGAKDPVNLDTAEHQLMRVGTDANAYKSQFRKALQEILTTFSPLRSY